MIQARISGGINFCKYTCGKWTKGSNEARVRAEMECSKGKMYSIYGMWQRQLQWKEQWPPNESLLSGAQSLVEAAREEAVLC